MSHSVVRTSTETSSQFPFGSQQQQDISAGHSTGVVAPTPIIKRTTNSAHNPSIVTAKSAVNSPQLPSLLTLPPSTIPNGLPSQLEAITPSTTSEVSSPYAVSSANVASPPFTSPALLSQPYGAHPPPYSPPSTATATTTINSSSVVPPPRPMTASPRLSVNAEGPPVTMTIPRGSVGSTLSASYGLLDPRRSSSKSPLLPVSTGKAEEFERKSVRLLYVWLGASTLVLQTTLFITMEDINNHYLPDMHYAFYCHIVFAFSFFIGTATFACFPARLLFSLRLLKTLNTAAVTAALLFPTIILLRRHMMMVSFIVALCLVGIITILSVLLIPVVFTTASAVPGECAMYAAFGQGLGAVTTALIAVLMGSFLSPKKFLLASATIAMLTHAVAIIFITKLQKWSWATKRLQRLSDVHRTAKTTKPVEAVARRPSSMVSARRPSAKEQYCFPILRRVKLQLLCAFLATLVSFSLFPAFSVRLGDGVSRGFGVAMVAIFHGSDQIGRHFPEIGLGLPPFLLTLLMVCRLAFLPLYVLVFNAANAFLASAWTKGFLQALLGLSHGWAVASTFRYMPSGSSKYEIERIQFSLSLSNAIGIPCGAMLMAALVGAGVFPAI